MKVTGIVRKIDNLGRIVIPKELRNTMDIDFKDPIEIYVDNNGNIILKKYKPRCVFCGNKEEVIEYEDKNICKDCIQEFKKIRNGR